MICSYQGITETPTKPEWINIRICPTKHAFIIENVHVRKSYFDPYVLQN